MNEEKIKLEEKSKDNYFYFSIGICCIVLLIVGIYISKPINEIKIISWDLENFNVYDINPKNLQRITDFVSDYDIIALQSIDSKYEQDDCGYFMNDYRDIEYAFYKFLPKNYNLSISKQSGDRRFMFIWNTKKVKNLEDWTQIIKERNTSLCENDTNRLMLRDPYITAFNTNILDFALLNVDNLGTHSEDYQLDYIMKQMYFMYNETNQLMPNFIIVGDLGLYKNNTNYLNYKQYVWAINGSNQNFIYINDIDEFVKESGIVENYPEEISKNKPVYMIVG